VIVKNERPPNYEQIAAAFNIKGRYGIIFTYGSTIYNPDGEPVSPDLFAHEEVHERQQRDILALSLNRPTNGPAEWWDRYIADPEFRLDQEVEAYRAQYKFAQENYGRDQRRALLKHISKALAGPMYGYLMSPDEARRTIQRGQ